MRMIYKSNPLGFLENTVKICNVKKAPFAISQAKIIVCDEFQILRDRFAVCLQKSDAERHVHGVLAAPCRRTSDTSPPQSDTPVPYMQKLCQPSQPAEPKLIFFGNRDTACFQDVLQHPNPLALSLNFFFSHVKVFHRLALHLVVAGSFQF